MVGDVSLHVLALELRLMTVARETQQLSQEVTGTAGHLDSSSVVLIVRPDFVGLGLIHTVSYSQGSFLTSTALTLNTCSTVCAPPTTAVSHQKSDSLNPSVLSSS